MKKKYIYIVLALFAFIASTVLANDTLAAPIEGDDGYIAVTEEINLYAECSDCATTVQKIIWLCERMAETSNLLAPYLRDVMAEALEGRKRHIEAFYAEAEIKPTLQETNTKIWLCNKAYFKALRILQKLPTKTFYFMLTDCAERGRSKEKHDAWLKSLEEDARWMLGHIYPIKAAKQAEENKK